VHLRLLEVFQISIIQSLDSFSSDKDDEPRYFPVPFRDDSVMVPGSTFALVELVSDLLNEPLGNVVDEAFSAYLKNTDPMDVRMNRSYAISVGIRYVVQDKLDNLNTELVARGREPLRMPDNKNIDWFASMNDYLRRDGKK